jgi:iron complex outermembrane receptor protein
MEKIQKVGPDRFFILPMFFQSRDERFFKMKKLIIAGVFIGMAFTLKAQFFIYGNITDENGNTLTGVAVQIAGTNSGTTTDQQGKYRLGPVEPGNYELTVHYLGYNNQQKKAELKADLELNFKMIASSFLTDEVLVQSTRIGKVAAGTATAIDQKTIAANNLGADLPYLMSLTPSLVTNSDAGAGIGYTGFRIRGTDANRINVTVNGIPLNDAESHGVFWVNMPDFASSVENIEIQRGVGTSTNGAAAFGATVNMLTSQFERQPFAIISSSAGSFNTFKNSVRVGSGLLNNHFVVEARLSKIKSDGYIDRAFSDLSSWFVSGGYYSEKTLIKLNVFSGKEHTYQAWNGIPKVRLDNDTLGMLRYGEHWLYSEQEVQEMLNSGSRTYNLYTYKNQTDNYQQDHYQLFLSHDFGMGLTANAALHYTYGRGYYEEYKTGADLADYGID